MPLTITDEELASAGLTAGEARLELACRLFAAQRLSLAQATRWSGLSRVDFETELIARRIPVYRVTEESWEQEATVFPPQAPAL
jgi:predicted HTH domain antitoxin